MSEEIGDLLARLRAATGAAYVLDVEIARVVGLGPRIVPRPYTASLDAALTLVPEGADWSLHQESADRASAWIYPAEGDTIIAEEVATPALALCIAALEARRAGGCA